MAQIAITQQQDGTTTKLLVPWSEIAIEDLFGSLHGKGVFLEGQGKKCAVRIKLTDAEGRDWAQRLNAIYARARREERRREAASGVIAFPVAPEAQAGDVA